VAGYKKDDLCQGRTAKTCATPKGPVVRDGVLAFQQPGKGSYHDIVEERFEFWEYYRRPVLLTGWG
jgi:hypothetical protein